MKTWIKALLICVVCSWLVFALIGFALSQAVPDFKSQATNPDLASSVLHSMAEIADPLPANFTYKGGVDTAVVKVAILARNQYQIFLSNHCSSRATICKKQLPAIKASGH